MIRKIVRERSHRLPREYYCTQIWAGFTVCVNDKRTLFTSYNMVNQFVSILDWARKRNGRTLSVMAKQPRKLLIS
jgi:hypothetical protein